MKAKIFKIIITLAIALVLSAGIALAHDKNGRKHKSHGKAHGYYNDQHWDDHQHKWHKKYRKSYRHRYRHHKCYHGYQYHRHWRWHHPEWKKWRYKSRDHRHKHKRRIRKHRDDWELHGRDRHRRHQDSDGFIFGMSFDDPYMSVVIGTQGN